MLREKTRRCWIQPIDNDASRDEDEKPKEHRVVEYEGTEEGKRESKAQRAGATNAQASPIRPSCAGAAVFLNGFRTAWINLMASFWLGMMLNNSIIRGIMRQCSVQYLGSHRHLAHYKYARRISSP